jgi:hypothetical protein
MEDGMMRDLSAYSLASQRCRQIARRTAAAVAFAVVALLPLVAAQSPRAQLAPAQTRTNGLIMLLEFERIRGVRHWEAELDRRGLTALVQAQYDVLAKYPADFARMAGKGYVVAGIFSEKAFWDVPYEEQLARMREVKAEVEKITHKPMRVFGSRYFAYDENTLRAADALGVDYVLARGTAAERAIIYAPREYKAKIISVSNVPFKEMGTGSLCDYSLWARGSSDRDFAEVVDKVLAGRPSDLILVSHAYLGGTKLKWWQTYEKALASEHVTWRGFDDWVRAVKVVSAPNAEIPVNREVKYEEPKPAVPFWLLEDIPNLPPEGPAASPGQSQELICQ